MKTLLYFKYLAIGLFAANIPFVGFGMFVGWPAVVVTALAMTAIRPVLRSAWEEAGCCLAVGGFASVINSIGWLIYIKRPVEVPNTLMVLSMPSVVCSALIVLMLHRPSTEAA